MTASDGTYTITGLSAGSFRVQFSAPVGYANEYYNNTPDWGSATLVSVVEGQTTANINAQLELGGAISGMVTGPDGTTPLEGITVFATPTGGAFGIGSVTAPDGTYTITGLSVGSYRVQFSPATGSPYASEYYNNTSNWDLATPVSVVAGETTPNINAQLELGGAISGVVTGPDGVTPLAGVTVWAYPFAGSGSSFSASTAPDGTYTIIGMSAGSYRVQFSPPAGHANEYYNSTTDWNSAAEVSVVAGETTANINASLELGGVISGVVTGPDGVTPLLGVLVTAFSLAEGSGHGNVTGPEGFYTITGLPVGSYRVEFAPTGWTTPSASYASEYYENVRNWDSATPVSVAAATTTPDINASLELAFVVLASPQKTGAGEFKLSFAGTPDMLFQLKKKDDLNASEWTDVGTPVPAVPDYAESAGKVGTNSISITTPASKEFWKLVEVPQ